MAVQVAAPRVPTVFPLSDHQERLFTLYVSDNFSQRLRRDYVFTANNSSAQTTLRNRVLNGLGLGGLIGGVVTYIAVKYLGKDDESIDDPKTTLKITGFGAGCGAAIGALFGVKHTITQLEESQEYKLWKDEAIKSKVYPLFLKFLQDSDALEDLLCDLTQDLIIQPVKAPNGKVYEKAAIEDRLSRKAIEFPPERWAAMSADTKAEALLNFCPSRSCHLTSDMLTYDFTYHQKAATVLKSLLDQMNNEQFANGLLSYRIAMLKDRETLMNEIVREITAKFTSGSISESDFIAACRACRAHYALPQ